jgi:hypothetical protein
MTGARLTLITAEDPPCITKRFRLNGDGALVKRTTAHVTAGRMETVELASLSALGAFLQSLAPNQALAYGEPASTPVALVSEEAWALAGRPSGKLPRTRRTMRWSEGPGVMMLDYDAGDSALSRDKLVNAVRSAAPGLAPVAMLWLPSTSSCIWHEGRELRGIRGQRLYFLVQDASDIPRAGKALEVALWAAGHGHFMVSASGSLLARTLTDTSVWQPERIDFAAGAMCEPPLSQRRGAPVVIAGDVEFVDTAVALPEPDAASRLAAESFMAAARAEKSSEAQRVRAEWVAARTEALVERIKPKPEDVDRVREQARVTAERAVERSELLGDWIVTIVANDARCDVFVSQLLDNPAQYHGALTLDPLEPEYDGGRPVGKLFLYGARPRLHSFAHGSATYRLLRQPARTELVRGKEHDTVLSVLEKLRAAPDLFDFGDELVIVEDGHTHPLNADVLRHHLGGLTQFWRFHQTPNGGLVEVLENPPLTIARTVLGMGSRRRLRALAAVITAPTLRPDGSVLSAPGFDAATGLLLELDELPIEIPSQPTFEQAQDALEDLWRPFSEFPFAGPEDRGVMLAALITAAVRPALPTAPAIGFDAPVQGSGKTLLAKCLGVIATGEPPTMLPHVDSKHGGDEEIRKRIFSVLRAGSRVVLWDNIIGTFDSTSLAATLTAERITDRVLGVSQTTSVPNRALFVLTGNNMVLAGDMPRRVLRCRIDPQSETPFAREFDMDPLAHCTAHRQSLVAAALTLVRAWLNSGDGRAPGRTASFEQWDDFVRQCVVWCVRRIGFDGKDPMSTVENATAADPEVEAWREVLDAWLSTFGDRAVTAREVLDACKGTFADTPLGAALLEFGGGRDRMSPKTLGRVLLYRKDRIVGGMCLKRMPTLRAGTSLWRVTEGLERFEGFANHPRVTDVASTMYGGKHNPSNPSKPSGEVVEVSV